MIYLDISVSTPFTSVQVWVTFLCQVQISELYVPIKLENLLFLQIPLYPSLVYVYRFFSYLSQTHLKKTDIYLILDFKPSPYPELITV